MATHRNCFELIPSFVNVPDDSKSCSHQEGLKLAMAQYYKTFKQVFNCLARVKFEYGKKRFIFCENGKSEKKFLLHCLINK